MSEPKLISPLLDGHVMGAPISCHNGVRCCPAMKLNSEDKFIVKIISVPYSQTQLDALLLTGAYENTEAAMAYFKETADKICAEAEILRQLSRLDGFLPYDGWQVVPMEEPRLGYDVYLISSYKRSLEKHLRRESLSANEIISLGLDICNALSTCRRAGVLYVDLKPTNIFLSDNGEYRIGDLGFVPMASVSHTSLPVQFLSPYSPPEAFDPLNTIHTTADTFSLGMTLYQVCSGQKLPQTPVHPLPELTAVPKALAQVILKATALHPEDRWQSPVEMGQALAKCLYSDISQEESAVTPASMEETQVFSAVSGNGVIPQSRMQETKVLEREKVLAAVGGETKVLPQLHAPVSGDTRIIPTAQVLAASDPLMASQDTPSSQNRDTRSDTKVIPSMPASSKTEFEEEDPLLKEVLSSLDEDLAENDEDEDFDPPVLSAGNRPRKTSGKRFILPVILILVLSLLGYGAFYYYQNYYLQVIHSLTVEGQHNQLTVSVDTAIDETLLTVTCTDTYGNAMEQPLIGGSTVFTDLRPNSQYKITLEIGGFHKLVGKTSDVFNTESRTEVLSFAGITGAEDGSVLLTFTVEGPEPEQWIVTYSAEDEEPISQWFTGHSVTISKLTVPKEYTFTLAPSNELYMEGITTLQFTASSLVMAQNLSITACEADTLAVSWNSPENRSVSSWEVRCYGEDGYDQTQVTTENSIVFSGVNVTKPYYVEVTAEGMTQPARTSVTANPITISSLQVSEDDISSLTVSWDHTGTAPEDGWLLMYSLDGSNTQSVVKCENASAVISPKIFGSEYRFVIQAADSTSVFNGIHTYACPEPAGFDSHGFEQEKAVAYLIPTPAEEKWTSSNISSDDYVDQFTSGQKISIILYCESRFYIPEDTLSVMYVIRNSEGSVISKLVSQGEINWHTLWVYGSSHYGELNLPAAPTELGDYTLSIYFDGKFVVSADFSIVE